MGLSVTRKRLAIIVSVALLVAVGAMMLAPTASPSRLLAPAIFISYDDSGNESRIIFSVTEGTGETSVEVYDDANWGKPYGRFLSGSDYEYDPTSGEVRFAGRTWVLTGDAGSRRLENVEAENGRLWGVYYENELEARQAEPFRPANRE